MAKVEANIDGLNSLMRMLKKDYRVRVGILGSKASAQHQGTNLTNAELGAVHEFGAEIKHPGGTPYYINTSTGMGVFVKKNSLFGQSLTDKGQVTVPHEINIPARSFLAEPLTEKLSEEIPKMKKVIFKQFFVKKAPEQFFQGLMSKSLDIVRGAFNSNGYGRWKPLTAATKRYKARKNLSPNTLVGRGTLSGSITAKVIKK